LIHKTPLFPEKNSESCRIFLRRSLMPESRSQEDEDQAYLKAMDKSRAVKGEK
jgi:hypothetical protein